jgi:hypothetical protein
LLEIFEDRASAHPLVTNHDGTNLLEESSSNPDDVDNEDDYHTADDDGDDDHTTDDDDSDIISIWGTSRHEYGLGSSEETNNTDAANDVMEDSELMKRKTRKGDDSDSDSDKDNHESGRSSRSDKTLVSMAQDNVRKSKEMKKKLKNERAGSKDMLPVLGSREWALRFDKRFRETKRHHKAIEKAAKRQATANLWDAKRQELEYKVALYKHYTELKERRMMNDEQIVKLFPDMHVFIQK